MWLMDDVTICDVRARGIRIWQINSQNFRVRKIWKTWFLDMGAFSWQNATYTIQFILTICINSEKIMLPGRCAPVEFFSWKCGKLRKRAKSGYPALIWPFRTSVFSALSWNKISHMKLQSLKMFKTTKVEFYKQFDFFLQIDRAHYGGFVNLVLSFLKNKSMLKSKMPSFQQKGTTPFIWPTMRPSHGFWEQGNEGNHFRGTREQRSKNEGN